MGRGTLGAPPGSPMTEEIGRANALNATYYWTAERRGRFGKVTAPAAIERATTNAETPSRSELPGACVALSGGGIRAAAVAAGVLSYLGRRGALGRVDYLSSTSGGSYAAGWLYAAIKSEGGMLSAVQNESVAFPWFAQDSAGALHRTEVPEREEVAAEIVRNKYMNRLLANSNFVSGSRLTSGAASVPFVLPIVMISRGIGGSTSTQGGAGLIYAQAIDKAFFDRQPLKVGDLHSDSVFAQTPYPIFVGSVALGSKRPCGDQDFGRSLKDAIEITPNRLGNHSIGFSDQYVDERLNRIVSSVAAAPDDPRMETWCRLSDALSLDTGMRFGTFAAIPSAASTNVALSDCDPKKRRDPAQEGNPVCYPEGMQVSDGGFVDNLAVSPLIERICKHIVVVDAEHDPTLEFAAYRKLKRLLKAERNLDLSIDDIDRHVSADANSGSPFIRRVPGRTKFRADLLVKNGFVGKVDVPYFDRSNESHGSVSVKITYLKLGLDGVNSASYSFPIRVQYGLSFHESEFHDPVFGLQCKQGAGILSLRCPFPQESTERQTFTPLEFWAYAALGAKLAAEVAFERQP